MNRLQGPLCWQKSAVPLPQIPFCRPQSADLSADTKRGNHNFIGRVGPNGESALNTLLAGTGIQILPDAQKLGVEVYFDDADPGYTVALEILSVPSGGLRITAGGSFSWQALSVEPSANIALPMATGVYDSQRPVLPGGTLSAIDGLLSGAGISLRQAEGLIVHHPHLARCSMEFSLNIPRSVRRSDCFFPLRPSLRDHYSLHQYYDAV